MSISMRHPIIVWASLALLIGPWGCAARSPAVFRWDLPPPPSEEIRAELGTIGVVSARFTPEAQLRLPVKGWLAGIWKGATNIFHDTDPGERSGGGWGGRAPGAGGVALLALAVITAAMVVGGVAGAVKAVPAAKVDEAEVVLKNTLAELKIQETIRDQVLQVARDQTRHPFVCLADPGPPSPHEEVSYLSLADKGIDTILEISVFRLGLEGEEGVNVPLTLLMSVRSKLIRTSDGTVRYDSILEYRSGELRFTDWAINNAEPFREELDRAYQVLAEKIVEELFLLYFPRTQRPAKG